MKIMYTVTIKVVEGVKFYLVSRDGQEIGAVSRSRSQWRATINGTNRAETTRTKKAGIQYVIQNAPKVTAGNVQPDQLTAYVNSLDANEMVASFWEFRAELKQLAKRFKFGFDVADQRALAAATLTALAARMDRSGIQSRNRKLYCEIADEVLEKTKLAS